MFLYELYNNRVNQFPIFSLAGSGMLINAVVSSKSLPMTNSGNKQRHLVSTSDGVVYKGMIVLSNRFKSDNLSSSATWNLSLFHNWVCDFYQLFIWIILYLMFTISCLFVEVSSSCDLIWMGSYTDLPNIGVIYKS